MERSRYWGAMEKEGITPISYSPFFLYSKDGALMIQWSFLSIPLASDGCDDNDLSMILAYSTGLSPQTLVWDLTSLSPKCHAKSSRHMQWPLSETTAILSFVINSRLFTGLFLLRFLLLLHSDCTISIWFLYHICSSVSI